MRFQAPRDIPGCFCREAMCGCAYPYGGTTAPIEKRTLTKLARAFADEMRRALHEQVDEGNGGWDREEWTVDEIKAALLAHVEKGDPVDVANFCAFWWNRLGGEK